MRAAAIDVGTNSTRLIVAEEHAGGFRTLERRSVITRLGEAVDRQRVLSPEALTRTLSTVADYAATCGEYSVEKLRVTGTSAVRDALNQMDFFTGVESLTGQRPRLLTGDEEARTTFLGAISDLDVTQPHLVLDIGGGSTELIYGRDHPEALVSTDVGSVRMHEKYLQSDPPSRDEIDALRAEVSESIEEFKADLKIESGTRLVGVAGTVTQLAALKAGLTVYDAEVTHHLTLTHGDVRLMVRRLESLPYEKRRRVKGLDPGRADVIVAGAHILLGVMETFDFPEILVSEKDILDGLVIELFDGS
ncbi:MAG: Ppx/GppA family phosphatase [Actinomycetota bacterium]|nr:Ppx/GppA family phosphatase [Actinomycetota bacterium]